MIHLIRELAPLKLDQATHPPLCRFLAQNALQVNDPTVNGAELLGARLTGRWKSGAPLAITPMRDDPELAEDPKRNNSFNFDPATQDACPFAAHVRKMNPRADIPQEAGINPHRIIRRGIQYGPEVCNEEREHNRTQKDRGLLFISYQSNLAEGFQFLQKSKSTRSSHPLFSYTFPYPESLTICNTSLTNRAEKQAGQIRWDFPRTRRSSRATIRSSARSWTRTTKGLEP